jgi:hypothetical protein
MATKKKLKLVHDADKQTQETALQAPDLSGIHGFKGVYALGTLNPDTKRLRATHYAVCLVYGREPTWGVWLVDGRFLRFASSRAQIERAYPKLVWRRKMAEWNLNNVDDLDVKRRKQYLREMYK